MVSSSSLGVNQIHKRHQEQDRLSKARQADRMLMICFYDNRAYQWTELAQTSAHYGGKVRNSYSEEEEELRVTRYKHLLTQSLSCRSPVTFSGLSYQRMSKSHQTYQKVNLYSLINHHCNKEEKYSSVQNYVTTACILFSIYHSNRLSFKFVK